MTRCTGTHFVRRRVGIAGVVLFLLASFSVHPAAQETINHASIGGRVTDATGAGMAGVRVTARQIETNASATTASDDGGRFRFPFLRTGAYELTLVQPGFTTVTRPLVLSAGSAFELPIAMDVASLGAEVTVTADAMVLEAARSQIAGTIAEAEVRALPMNGRNFLDLALLIPGVSATNVGGGTQLFPETSAIPGVGLSIGSQRNLSNNFIVDGLSANDDAAALSGMPYGVDAIEQFQVVTSGGQAELGRALGGYVNVVTKSGTNLLRGEVYEYARHSRFNAPNALSGRTLPMRQHQYGASLGGPLARDRTFYYANVELRRLDQSGLTSIRDDVVPLLNARLQETGYGGPAVVTGIFSNPIDTTNAVAKVDHQVGANHLTFRYSVYDVRSENARGAGGLNAPSASTGLDNRDQTIAFGNVVALSPRVVMDIRAQAAFSDLDASPTDPIGPAVSISGAATFGTQSSSPTRRINAMYQIVNSVSFQSGAHAFRAGTDLLYNDLDITYPRSVRGAYSFSSIDAFLAGAYNNAGFTQTFGATSVSQTNPNLGLYAQDEWKLTDTVTINLGLRYDLQFLQTIATDLDNIAPRIGAVWSPFASRRTLVRGSAGLFFDRVPLRALANALLSAGNTTDLAALRQISISLSPTQTSAPAFPNVLGGIVPAVTLVNFTTMDRNIQNAHSRQASVEIEHQVGARGTMTIGYAHLRGERLIMQVNQNVPSCAASGGNNGCRPNPDYANNNQYSSIANSVYDGLHVTFLQRPGKWGSVRVSYAYSKSMNNVGEAFFNSPIDPFDLSKDWGRSDDDQRHRLTMTGVAHTSLAPAVTPWQLLTHGFQFSGMVQSSSALPFNITSGATTIQGTAGRPIANGEFIARNAGIGSSFSTTNLRVSRAFSAGRARIDALVEIFNLFNRRNDIARNPVFGAGDFPASPAPAFGTVTAVGEPRSLQLGLRVRL